MTLIVALCSDVARGQSFTWSGAGGTASWTTAGNWLGGVAPTPGDTLEIILPASPTPTSYVVNVTGSNPWTLNRFTYGALQYNVTGNTLRFSGTNATFTVNTATHITGGFANPIDLASDLNFYGNHATNWWFNGPISGLGGFYSLGGGASGGRLTHFVSQNSYAGVSQLYSPVNLAAGGRVANTSSLNIHAEVGTLRDPFTIDVSGSFANRVVDTIPINLHGGYLRNQTGDETVGRTTFLQGYSGVYSQAANNAILRISSLERANGATGMIGGLRLGATGTASGARVLVLNPDSAGRTVTDQLVGGGGAAGSTTISVFPWLAGGTSTGLANTLLTYDAVSGFRPLDPLTEFVSNPSNWSALSASDNVRVVGSGTTTLTGDPTINSLLFGDGNSASMNLTGTGRLTVNSGAIVYQNNATGATISVAQLDFAGRGGAFTQSTYGGGGGTSLTISSAIVNASGVSFGGGSDTSVNISVHTLSGSSTYSGTTAVNASGLQIASADNRLPTTTVLMVARTASFNLSNNSSSTGWNQTIAGLQGQGTVGNQGNAQRTLTINTGNAADDFLFEGPLTGGTNFVLAKNGPGRQTLSGTSTYTGPTSIGGGTLRIGGAGQLGSGAYAGAISNAGLLVLSSSANQTLSGTISGTGSLVQMGSGTLTLAAANTYTGSTSIQGATLVLDFTAATAAASNVLPAASALSMQAGTLQIVGKASTTNSQATSGLAIAGGAAQVTLSANATANPLSLSVGAITRSAGATLNITNPTGAIGATNGLITTSTNTSGILGGWATVGNADWAVANAGSGITALAAYTSDSWAAGTNTTVTTNASPADGSTTNSLRFNTAGAAAVTLSGVNTVSSGGVLVTSTVGANSPQITGGTLRGSSGGELIVIQNNAAGGFTIGSTIADNGSATGLTKSGAGVLTLTGTSTFTGPTVINAGGVLLGGAGLIGSGTYAGGIANAGSLLYASSASQTLSGAISGTGSLILQAGAATLTLTGTSTSTGPVTITGGTLRIAGSGRLGSGTHTGGIANNSALLYESAATQSLAGVLSGTGAFTQAGAGLLSIDAPGSYGGSITVSSGTLRIGTRGWLGTGTFGGSITNNATFDYASILEQTVTGPIGGTGSLAVSATTTLTLSGTNTYTGATTIGSGGVLQVTSTAALYGGTAANWTKSNITVGSGGTLVVNTGTAAGTTAFTAANVTSLLSGLGGGVNNNGLLAGSSIGFDTTAVTSSGTFTMADVIADTTGAGGGAVGLVKYGVGTLAMTGTQTFTGPIALSRGTLLISGSGRLGGGSYAGNILNYGTLNYSSNRDQTLSGQITGDGTLTKSGTGALTLTGTSGFVGGMTISAGVLRVGGAGVLGFGNYAGSIGITGTFDHASSADQLLSGVISGAGPLLKTGAARLTLTNNANTATGVITISSGTLHIGGSGRLNNGSFASAIANNAVFDYASTAAQTISGTLTGSGTALLSGSGRLTFSGTNPFGGRFVVTGSSAGTGYVQFTQPSALYSGSTAAWTKENISVGNGGLVVLSVGGAGQFSDSNIQTVVSNLTSGIAGNGLQAGSSIGISTAGGNATLTGTFADSTGSGSGAVGFVKSDANSLTLTGSNTYTGSTQVWAGTLVLAGGDNRINPASPIVLGAIANTAGTLVLGDASGPVSQQFSSLTNVGTGASAVVNGATSGTSTIVVSTTTTGTYSGVVGGGGAGQNNLGFTKTGTGTLVMTTATNTYTGPTTINGGILQFTGTAGLYAGNSASWTKANIRVGNGGTLVVSTGTAAGTTAFSAANVTSLLSGLGGVVSNNGLQAGSAIGFDTGAVGTSGTFTVADAINDTTGSGGGSVGLWKSGNGRLILSGTSNYSGNTTITGGGLVVDGRLGASGTYAGNIINNSVVPTAGQATAWGGLVFTGSADRQVLTGVVSGSTGWLWKYGSGTLVLTGSNLVTPVVGVGNSGNTVGAGNIINGRLNTAQGGVLLFGARAALFNGNTTYWAPDYIYSPQGQTSTFGLSVGGSGEFTSADLQTFTLQMLGTTSGDRGFLSGYFGLDTTNAPSGIFTTSVPISSNYSTLITNAAMGFNKLGSGILELTGTNTFTKGRDVPYGLIISQGTLRIGAAGSMATNFPILNSGEFNWASSNGYTITGNMSGTGSLRQSGPGILGLSGTQSYTGQTIVQSGTLQANARTALYGGTSANWTKENITVQNGALLVLVTSSNAADFSASDMSTLITNLATSVNNNGLRAGSAIGFNTNNGSLVFSGTVNDSTGTGGGAVGITKLGNNTLTLSSSNSYTGPSSVLAGTLLISNSSGLGGPIGPVLINGGTLDLGGLRVVRSGTVSLLAGTLQSGTITNDVATFDAQNGTLSASITGSAGLTKSTSGTVTMSGSHAYLGATTVSGGILTMSGVIGGTGGTVVTSGTLSITGTNAGTGPTTVSGGRLDVQTPAGLYNGGTANWTASNITVAAGGILSVRVAGAGLSAANVTTLLTNLGGTGGAVNNNGLLAGATIGIDAASANFTLADNVRDSTGTGGGAISLIKYGGNTLLLTGTSTYSGTTTVASGTLQLASNGQLGATGTFAGPIVLAGTLEHASARNQTLSGLISGAGGIGKNSGTGLLTITGSNTYTGKTSISSGTLSVAWLANGGQPSPLGAPTGTNAAIDIGSGANTGAFRYTGTGTATTDRLINMAGTTGGATLDASGFGPLVLTGGFTYNATGNKILTLTGSSTAANSIGALANAAVSATTSLVKTGPGSWTLTAASTFTGSSAILGGTMIVATNAPLDGNGAFGYSLNGGLGGGSSPVVTLGDGSAGASGTAAMLLDQGAQVGRLVMIPTLGAGGSQKVVIGGVNTTGTTRFQSAMSFYVNRDVTLQAASGGTIDLANGWLGGVAGAATPVTNSFTVGSVGNAGIVLLTGNLSTSGSVTVNHGMLHARSTLMATAGVTVSGSTAELKYNGIMPLSSPLYLVRGTLSGTGEIAADGGVIAGTGAILSPGNSPGIQPFTTGLTWARGGTYLWELNNWGTPSTAGTDYDQIQVSGSPLDITATSGSTFRIAITSLTASNTAGLVPNFDANSSRTFTIATSGAGVTGFDKSKFTLDTSSFANSLASGGFWIAADETNVYLNYTPFATYTLSATSAVSTMIVGGTTTITGIVTNTGTGGADTIDYSGFSAASLSGTLSLTPSSGLALAGGVSGTGTADFTPATAGSYTFTPQGTFLNTNLGVPATASGTTTTTVTVLEHSNAEFSLVSGGVQTIITGGTFAPVVFNLTNLGANRSPLEVANLVNLTGNTGAGVVASGGTASYEGTGFDAVTVGTGTVTMSLDAGDDQSLPGAFTLQTFSGSMAFTVLEHSYASFTNGTDSGVLTLDFGTYDTVHGGIWWPVGNAGNPIPYALWNFATNGNNALTAGLALTGTSVTGDAAGFELGIAEFFANLQSGTSNGYTALFNPELSALVTGTQSATFTLAFADQSGLSGGTAGRSLTINMNVVIVPEPTTMAMGAIGAAMAGYSYWRRRRCAA